MGRTIFDLMDEIFANDMVRPAVASKMCIRDRSYSMTSTLCVHSILLMSLGSRDWMCFSYAYNLQRARGSSYKTFRYLKG